MSSPLQRMIDTLPQQGQVVSIAVRPEKKAPLRSANQVTVNTTNGLVGDHYHSSSRKRQVTLIQAEHLEAVAAMLGHAQIDPLLTRRNIVVSGINLLAFKNRRFVIGEVTLEMTGPCEPCSRMEANFGSGGYNAMRGHGGICARVISGGEIKPGDPVFLAQ